MRSVELATANPWFHDDEREVVGCIQGLALPFQSAQDPFHGWEGTIWSSDSPAIFDTFEDCLNLQRLRIEIVDERFFEPAEWDNSLVAF
jgi:hypothetical protein